MLETGAGLTDEQLSHFARRRLAPFKVPRRMVFVDEIPRGPTGKISRARLAKALGLDPAQKRRGGAPAQPDRDPTPLEAQLAGLWAEALGLERVGLGDDFFLLGGDSLSAVEMFLRVEEVLGRRLPRASLFEASTVAEMARLIAAETPSRCLVPIQPEGRHPPFYCAHDGNGHVLNMRDLARCLGTDQPFYGIQSVGLDGSDVPFTRIEDMAAHYVSEILKLQPSGPYYLGGYSFGGRVAYVMAQLLREAGHEVALLALMDTYCYHGRRTVGLKEWLGRHARQIAKLRLMDMPAYSWLRVKNLIHMAHLRERVRFFSIAWRFFEKRGRPIPRFLRRPVEANDMARRDYVAKPYDGDAVLFKAALHYWTHTDAHEGWHELIRGNLEVRPVPGQHEDLMKEPHVRTLANELLACLGEARARRSAPARAEQLQEA